MLELLLMLNMEQQAPGTRRYIMKRRGVFKTMVSRRDKSVLTMNAVWGPKVNTWRLLVTNPVSG